MMKAYAEQRLQDYAAMMTADFGFTSPDADFAAAFPKGCSRVDEIIMADHLFRGFTDSRGVRRPRAVSIHVDLGHPITCLPNPWSSSSGPDDAHAMVLTPAMRMEITFEDGDRMEWGTAYAFELVRGSAARMAEDRVADSGTWYVCACHELAPGDMGNALASAPPDSAAPRDTVVKRPPVVGRGRLAGDSLAREVDLHGPLAILHLPNPAHFAIELEFRVPGEGLASVYDVQGRRVLRREVDDRGAGVHHVFLTDGDRVRPGVYWLRLGRGNERITRKVVLVP